MLGVYESFTVHNESYHKRFIRQPRPTEIGIAQRMGILLQLDTDTWLQKFKCCLVCDPLLNSPPIPRLLSNFTLTDDIVQVWHEFTMSPTWIQSQCGLFTDSPPKQASSIYIKSHQDNLSLLLELADIFKYYQELGLADNFSFIKSVPDHISFIKNYYKLLFNRPLL